jgi:hypothetical protein
MLLIVLGKPKILQQFTMETDQSGKEGKGVQQIKGRRFALDEYKMVQSGQ